MNALLSREEWETLTRLYGAGRRGFVAVNGRYPAAGSWDAVRALRDADPPLARELFRQDETLQTIVYYVAITEAGERVYEKNRRMYNTFYPSQG
ncbi:MAG: hypothetical protein GX613_06230 [Chloroflexi bacterium]|nr:hypothetical protein [Chloroflexota bacterium]